jgi:hypothetical protein
MMERIHTVEGICPVCGDQMVIARLSCGNCGSALEGSFALNAQAAQFEETEAYRQGEQDESDERRFGRLARLDDRQLEFVEVFLRCRGIIKNVEDMLGISYPTVKARLAGVLESMGLGAEEEGPSADHRRARREILADLAAGRISTDEALQVLARETLGTTATMEKDHAG